jgi:2-polyprenyl-3-methyl-5-hydroxy-6-metoxy-1,4-benzoquinol methylase
MELIAKCPVCDSDQLANYLSCVDYTVSKKEFQVQKCSQCGFIFTNPRPSEDAIGPYYESEDYISHSGTSKGLVNRLYHLVRNYSIKSKRRLIARYSPGKKILDIGSGTGEFLNELDQKGYSVIGLEPNEAARKQSISNYTLSILEPGKSQEFNEDSFDAVTMWHVLEHVHRLNEQVSEINRLLKTGGVAVIAVPNPSSADASIYKEVWAGYDVPRHLYHFTPSTIERLFDKHGFSMIKKKIMPFDSFYVSLLSEKYKKSSLAFFRGMFFGKISWLIALFNPNKASSLIYIFKKS